MRHIAIIALSFAIAVPSFAQKLLPWQETVEVPVPGQTQSLETLFDQPWQANGDAGTDLTVAKDPGPWGGKCFAFDVKISHHRPGQYPMAWPSFETRQTPQTPWTGYDAVRYWIRCDTQVTGSLPIRFILWTEGQGRINELLPSFKAGQWVQVTHRIKDFPALDKIDRIHFFLCDADYKDGDELHFKIGGFELCNLRREVAPFPADNVAMGLWVGERADTNDDAVILNQGAKSLPGLLVTQTGDNVSLRATDDLKVRFHEVFSGKDTVRAGKLGQDVPAGKIARISSQLDVSGLAPGYYLVVADVLRDGKSLLGGRVGSDDLYIRKPGESMTYTVLSIRTGMVMFVRDLLYGDIMGATKIALPHVYDPLDKTTYGDFVRLFSGWSGKHTEGNEAGDTGLALAAEAFRKSGDTVRCKFTEWLMEDSFNHMIAKMQAPSGATNTWSNELADNGMGAGGRSEGFGSYDPNQIGEWMRAITYGIIYYSNIPEKRAYARKLSAAVRKAGDYIVAHALVPEGDTPNLLRHVMIAEQPDGKVLQTLYHQEGRQCDVYLGRALAGLSYYAYAAQLLGEKIPDKWFAVMDDTVKWSIAKMKPNGWFDWQCGDTVEGGCHTFLGNIYIGEGMFGCYMADKLAGRTEAAKIAAEGTLKAYRYVTDDCWIKGKQYTALSATEFWVGPYVYWLFTEYQDAIGHDQAIDGWLKALDGFWRVDRKWRDFVGRPCADPCGRSDGNGMLVVAIEGYLGVRQMEEINKPLHWRVGQASR
jgi:hypothetical protein